MKCCSPVVMTETGLRDRDRDRGREMGQGQRLRERGDSDKAGSVGRQEAPGEAAGQPIPQKCLHNRKRLVTYLWFGQALGLPERSPLLPQLQPPRLRWGAWSLQSLPRALVPPPSLKGVSQGHAPVRSTRSLLPQGPLFNWTSDSSSVKWDGA